MNNFEQNAAEKTKIEYPCDTCDRKFSSKGGRTNHQRKCKTDGENVDKNVVTQKNENNRKEAVPVANNRNIHDVNQTSIAAPSVPTKEDFVRINVNQIYEKIVFWRSNLFLLPTGKSGRNFILELTRLINAWVDNSAMKDISLKMIMIMPALLLQKPSRTSKSKDHSKALERRLSLWEEGRLTELLFEAETIQETLSTSKKKANTTAELSKKFIKKMQTGNINGAIKLLSNNMVNGILPLNQKTLDMLHEKHPNATTASEGALLSDAPTKIHPVKFDGINADYVRQAALKTKGGSGPSGLDSEGWRRILTSKQFGQYSTDLCTSIAEMTKLLCAETHSPKSLEPLLASRLIPLNKNPDVLLERSYQKW